MDSGLLKLLLLPLAIAAPHLGLFADSRSEPAKPETKPCFRTVTSVTQGPSKSGKPVKRVITRIEPCNWS